MSTKLGVHIASDDRGKRETSFVRLLEVGAPLVMAVDQNVIAEAHQYGAKVIYRTRQPHGLDNPLGIDGAAYTDIPRIAQQWMSTLIPLWARNAGADGYAPNNEWDIGTPESGLLINAFALECMRIAEAAGLKLCVLNISTGNPSDDVLADGTPFSMEARLLTVLPALTHAALNGHVIGLHVHAGGVGDLKKTGEHIALRHERFFRFCEVYNFLPTVAITELSNGVGGIEPSLGKYLQAMAWWDAQVQASKYADHILGGCLYGFNAAETIAEAVPGLVKIMRGIAPPPDASSDPIVNFSGACKLSKYGDIAAAIVAAGGSIARVS